MCCKKNDHFENDKSSLITMLQQIQESCGFISQKDISLISDKTGIPESTVFGVVTFYSQFRLTKPGKHVIRVCHGTACHVGGAGEITEALEKELKIKSNQTTADGMYTLESVACLGCCSLAPVMTVDGETFGKLSPQKALKIIREHSDRSAQ